MTVNRPFFALRSRSLLHFTIHTLLEAIYMWLLSTKSFSEVRERERRGRREGIKPFLLCYLPPN